LDSVEIVLVLDEDAGISHSKSGISVFASTCTLFSQFQFMQEFAVSKKLYVGNLPYSATEAQLRTLFSQVGEITDVAIIKDRETGKSKGFGFVEMETDEGAQEAIKRFNGYSLDNRPLTVNEARPREERGGGGGGGYRGGGGGGGGGGGRRDDYRRDTGRDGGFRRDRF
jgi:RNA recognition motif-containing protein